MAAYESSLNRLRPEASTSTSAAAGPAPAVDSPVQIPPAFAPLKFCEILHAYWADKNGKLASLSAALPPAPPSLPSTGTGLNKGKGREQSVSNELLKERATTTKKRKTVGRILRQSKSLYARVNLADSDSCMRRVDALKYDPTRRKQVDKLVTLARASSSPKSVSTSTTLEENTDISAGPSTTLTGTSVTLQKHCTTTAGLPKTNIRTETLEACVYLRVLISETILHYIKKHTGCKYIWHGYEVKHYLSQRENGDINDAEAVKKTYCSFHYWCASAQYENPPCGGSLRITVDLDIGNDLVSGRPVNDRDIATNTRQHLSHKVNINGRHHSEETEMQSSRELSASMHTPRRPLVTKTYGSRQKNPDTLRFSSFPLSSAQKHPTEPVSESPSSSHLPIVPATSSSKPTNALIFSIRLTHLKPHKESYTTLRSKYNSAQLQIQKKMAKAEKKMIKVSQKLEQAKKWNEMKDVEMTRREVDAVWNGVTEMEMNWMHGSGGNSDSDSSSSESDTEIEVEVETEVDVEAENDQSEENDDEESGERKNSDEMVKTDPNSASSDYEQEIIPDDNTSDEDYIPNAKKSTPLRRRSRALAKSIPTTNLRQSTSKATNRRKSEPAPLMDGMNGVNGRVSDTESSEEHLEESMQQSSSQMKAGRRSIGIEKRPLETNRPLPTQRNQSAFTFVAPYQLTMPENTSTGSSSSAAPARPVPRKPLFPPSSASTARPFGRRGTRTATEPAPEESSSSESERDMLSTKQKEAGQSKGDSEEDIDQVTDYSEPEPSMRNNKRKRSSRQETQDEDDEIVGGSSQDVAVIGTKASLTIDVMRGSSIASRGSAPSRGRLAISRMIAASAKKVRKVA